MKKAFIAAAIVLASALTALSVAKKSGDTKTPVNTQTVKADFAVKTASTAKDDLGTVQ